MEVLINGVNYVPVGCNLLPPDLLEKYVRYDEILSVRTDDDIILREYLKLLMDDVWMYDKAKCYQYDIYDLLISEHYIEDYVDGEELIRELITYIFTRG